MSDASGPLTRVRLWDLPIRIVHWSFALLLPALWWTERQGSMSLHERLGYITLALLIFRLFWGFSGGSTARFRGFVKGPAAVVAYLRGLFSKGAEPIVGHNPLGGWSVIVLLGLLAAQVGLGLFTQDVDGIESGPLARYVSYETADKARYFHGLVFYFLLAAVAVHLCAITFYLLVKRDNLVGPMVTGHKRMAATIVAPVFAPAWRVAVGIALAGGIAWWVSRGCPLP